MKDKYYVYVERFSSLVTISEVKIIDSKLELFKFANSLERAKSGFPNGTTFTINK